MIEFAFDHVVLAVDDVEIGSERFADATGCRPIGGGPHPSMGTRNAIVAFEGTRYLELIGPDEATRTDENFGGRLARLESDRLLGWAIRTNRLEQLAAEATHHGLAPTSPLAVHRLRPDGTRLDWEMVGLRGMGGAWPFFLDWHDAPHPSQDAPIVGALLGFEARLPVDDAKSLPFSRTPDVVFGEGSPRLAVRFASSRGEIEWSQDAPGGLFG